MATGRKTAAPQAHPVARLKERAAALEAAMTTATANPGERAVHQLRTSVRRLEAQIALWRQVAEQKKESAETRELRRQLAKVRRVAGEVRDLDVLRGLLRSTPDLPQAAAQHLDEILGEDRETGAASLQKSVLKRLPKVVGAMEQLVQSVGTANGLTLPDLRLLHHVERWTKQKQLTSEPNRLNDEELHTVRKVAKSARYMAESGAGTPEAKAMAARFEAQQEAGGQWHDWAELEAAARKHFGNKDALTKAAAEHCAVARAKYVALLEAEKADLPLREG